jgi:hypothetical protein
MAVIINGTTGITSPSPFVLEGSTSGTVTVAAPAVAGTNTQTLVAATDTLAPVVRATAITLTNQTAPAFTDIPSWVKRITLMFQGVSANSTGAPLIQLGTGSTTYTTSGYLGASSSMDAGVGTSSYTTGFGLRSLGAANLLHGNIVIANVTGNVWSASGNIAFSNVGVSVITAGSVSLGATLTAVRLFIDGTQFFDAGTINILYE